MAETAAGGFEREGSDFAAFNGMSAVCFRDLIGEKENDDKRRRERRLSWHPSRDGSKRSQRSSGAESCDSPSVEFSDGNDSTTSSSSSSLTTAAFKDLNGVRSTVQVAGKKNLKSDGGGLLCGLMLQRRFSYCPSDQNLLTLTGFRDRKI